MLFALVFMNTIGQNSYSELIAKGGFVDNPHKISGNELLFLINDSVGTLHLSESDLGIIVNLDVSSAFNLGYSELEMKKYKQTEAYKEQLRQLRKLRDHIMNATWYYPVKLGDYSRYDVKNDGFVIEGQGDDVRTTYPQKNYINFDDFVFLQMNPSVLKIMYRRNYKKDLWQKKYFYLPLNDIDVAIDIERNPKGKYVLIAMKIKESSSYTIDIPPLSIEKDIMIFRPVGFYYVDKETNKILYNANNFLNKYPIINTKKRKK